MDLTFEDLQELPKIPVKRPRKVRDYEYRYQGGLCRSGVKSKSKRASGSKRLQGQDELLYHQDGVEIQDFQESHEPVEEPTCDEPPVETLVVDDAYFYAQQLMHFESFHELDDSVFAVQELQNNRLTARKYLIVKRRPMSCAGRALWMYMCECNPARSAYIAGIPCVLSDTVDKVEASGSVYEKCPHILAVEIIADCLDKERGNDAEAALEIIKSSREGDLDHHYDVAKSEVEPELHGLMEEPPVACVKSLDGTYGVLVLHRSDGKLELKCLQCRSSTRCCHVTVMEGFIRDDDQDIAGIFKESLKSGIEFTSGYLHSCLSHTRIPVFGKHPDSSAVADGELSPHCDGYCVCNRPWRLDQKEVDKPAAYLFHEDTIETVKVFKFSCAECDTCKHYDGIVDGILNMDNFLISLKVLHRYLRLFMSEGMTMYSFFKLWTWEQLDNSAFQSMTYAWFRSAWYGFLDLLDINFDEGFHCPTCGDEPTTVVMDGITLGLRKSLLPATGRMQVHPSSDQFDGSSHNTRVFLNNKKGREMLQNYAQGKLNKQNFDSLKSNIMLYQPSLAPLFEEFEDKDYFSKPPECYKKLLCALSKSYPVCALVHPSEEVLQLLQKMSEGHNCMEIPAEMRLLQCHIPILFDVVCAENGVNPLLHPVLKELIQISCAPFVQGKPHSLPACTEQDRMGMFPTLPERVQRGRYILDQAKLTRELLDDCDKAKVMKKKKGHQTLVPGIFTLLCPHGVCYGFQLMTNFESPDMPFTILRTRFVTAPSMVIYDNGCNLHSYCLNRDPVFFKDTWFVVDRFHWKNHRGCSEGYNLSRYPQFTSVNTQVAEQRNSSLVKLKPMLSYMNFSNFMKHCHLYLWFRNMITIAGLHTDPELQYKDSFMKLAKVFSRTKT